MTDTPSLTAEKPSFVQAFYRDMQDKKLVEADIGRAMDISQQAVNRWIDRGFPPMSKLDELVQVLGPNSQVAKLSREDIYKDRMTRTPKKPTDAAAQGLRIGLSAVKLYAKEQKAKFEQLMPSDVLDYVGVSRKVGTTSVQVDYGSRTLALVMNFQVGYEVSHSPAHCVLRLMLFKDINGGSKRAVYALVNADGGQTFGVVATAASARYGIELMHFKSSAEVARFVTEAETGFPAEPQYAAEPDDLSDE